MRFNKGNVGRGRKKMSPEDLQKCNEVFNYIWKCWDMMREGL